MNKTVKKIVSLFLIGAMAIPMAACSKIQPIKPKDFGKALESALDLDDDDYYEDKGSDYKYCSYYDDITAYCYQYDDEDDAYDQFDDIKDLYDDMMDDKDFSGKTKVVTGKDFGYILLNGEGDSNDFIDDDFYGGFYYTGDTFVVIYTTSTSDKKIQMVKDLISELGYPKP
ncbi:MAG: hypothetical protein IJ869_03245 [Clostridiales bacterium]|nr:hypothetical protein [Clostridiales bacterium]